VTVQRTYDEHDRLKTVTIPQLSRLLEMEYDKASNRTGFSINGQKITYTFNGLNRLIKLVHPSGAQATWEYNPISLVTKKTLPNGITADMTYDRRRLTNMVYKNAAGAPIANFAYTFDAIANILTMTDDEGQHRYSYDTQNRLTSVFYPDGLFEMFGYDASSNRVSRRVDTTREETTYDPADQIVQTRVIVPNPAPCPTPTPSPCPTEILLEQRDYGHDDSGNLTQIKTTKYQGVSPTVETTSFFYDVRDKLTRVTLNDGRFLDNEYYPDSPLRLSFTNGAGVLTKTVWDPVTDDLAQDLDAAGAVMAEYIQGIRIDDTIGMIRGGSTYAYIGDRLNSIRALVDGSGAVQNRYRYEAFGLARLTQEAVVNRLRFTAREWDPAVGTQYNRWRHYLSQIGRWTQRDPLGVESGLNLYVYVQSNPANGTDPTGLVMPPPEGYPDVPPNLPKPLDAKGCGIILNWLKDKCLVKNRCSPARLAICYFHAGVFYDACMDLVRRRKPN
jgi:RHS repeat-associated protein